jgi:hypothetical protein
VRIVIVYDVLCNSKKRIHSYYYVCRHKCISMCTEKVMHLEKPNDKYYETEGVYIIDRVVNIYGIFHIALYYICLHALNFFCDK